MFATDDGLRVVPEGIAGSRAIDRDELVARLGMMRAAGSDALEPDALSAMRRTMAAETVLRVVASGKVVGYRGHQPGIVEEALLQAAAGRLVVPLGAFGGAARDVAIELGLLPETARIRYAATGENYYPALADLGKLANAHRHAAEDAAIWRELQALAEADDPTVIAVGVRRIADRLSGHSAAAAVKR